MRRRARPPPWAQKRTASNAARLWGWPKAARSTAILVTELSRWGRGKIRKCHVAESARIFVADQFLRRWQCRRCLNGRGPFGRLNGRRSRLSVNPEPVLCRHPQWENLLLLEALPARAGMNPVRVSASLTQPHRPSLAVFSPALSLPRNLEFRRLRAS